MKALYDIKEGTTPQMERARDDEVKNNAGGYVFAVTPKVRLERFLILGTDGGTYYVKQRDLTKQNYDFLKSYARKNLREMVDTIVAISDQGRAPKNTPAIFALAVALTFGEDKAYVKAAVNKVVRTGTHLYEFSQFIDNLGGWGRAKRSAVAGWFEGRDADQLAYQAVKYRQRNGWTMRDVMRLSHPQGIDPRVGNFILGKEADVSSRVEIIEAFRKAQSVTKVSEAVRLIQDSNLPWEAFPTAMHNEPEFWSALFEKGSLPTGALLRNVTRFAKLGLFNSMDFSTKVAERLTDEQAIAKARLHPLQYLVTGNMYSGFGDTAYYSYRQPVRNWQVESIISVALEDGFYAAFKSVEPSGKRTMLALDVSGSMGWAAIAGMAGITPAVGSAAMAMVTARTEKKHMIKAFSHQLVDTGVTAGQSLNTVINKLGDIPMGGTDLAKPMEWARKNKVEVDIFVSYTDSETWAGRNGHPFEALKAYRDAMGIPAKMVVVGMTSTEFTIADPKDAGSMDVVGFDTTAPSVIADFARN